MCPESHVNHAGDAGHEQRDAAPGGRAGAKAAQRPAAVTVSWAAGSGGARRRESLSRRRSWWRPLTPNLA